MRFSVGIADLATKPHNKCFHEISRALAFSLRDLGHEVVPLSHPRPGRLIIFGANDTKINIPEDAIIFNAEQVAVAEKPLKLIARTDRLVWDYSEANIAKWRELGVKAVHCPVGYHPSMAMTYVYEMEQDVDVLFYGWLNDRRRTILESIANAGLEVKHLSGEYGAVRDGWISRSKVILNLHYFEPAVFEIFRVSHLLANKKCVVTEEGSVDDQLDRLARRTCLYVSRAEIVDACRSMVGGTLGRKWLEEQGHDVFSRVSLIESVRSALSASDCTV